MFGTYHTSVVTLNSIFIPGFVWNFSGRSPALLLIVHTVRFMYIVSVYSFRTWTYESYLVITMMSHVHAYNSPPPSYISFMFNTSKLLTTSASTVNALCSIHHTKSSAFLLGHFYYIIKAPRRINIGRDARRSTRRKRLLRSERQRRLPTSARRRRLPRRERRRRLPRGDC